VEGAEALPVLSARPLQLHDLADDLEDVGRGADLVEELLEYPPGMGGRLKPVLGWRFMLT